MRDWLPGWRLIGEYLLAGVVIVAAICWFVGTGWGALWPRW